MFLLGPGQVAARLWCCWSAGVATAVLMPALAAASNVGAPADTTPPTISGWPQRNNPLTTTLASANGPTLKAGDELLFRAIGTTLELWRLDAGAWTKILTATNGTYQGAGYLDLTARDGAVRLANFGGGTLP